MLAGSTPILVHNEDGYSCDLNGLRKKLTERNGGATSGVATNGHGVVTNVITSSKTELVSLVARVNSSLKQWGFRSPAMCSSDVEQKVAAGMLNADGTTREGFEHVSLLINSRGGVCDEPLGCDMVVTYLLNKGQSLTVYSWDHEGALNTHIYYGLADFQ
ncbi:DddA-like double-stranded DNA deaminase toxin [Kitasatospora cineracea]